MGRPSAGTLRDLELRLARAEARAETAERVLDQMLAAMAKGGGAPATAMPAPVAMPEPPSIEDAAKIAAAVTPRVRAECDQWGDTPKQRALNLSRAYDLARKGQSEAEILKAIRQGERMEAIR